MRVKIDWRSGAVSTYKDFRKCYPNNKLSLSEWKSIIYMFNESFRNYVLETGEKVKFPSGFGEFAISKKKRRKYKEKDGKKFINLPIDWKKTKEAGKRVYHLNHHTENYFFGWVWFKKKSMVKFSKLWYFKPSRASSRLICHYLKADNKYQHIYKEWNTNVNKI